MTIVCLCEYCKHNKGENEKFHFMWYCELLEHCVPFGYHRCKAQQKGKGSFAVDSAKKKEFDQLVKKKK